MTHKALPALQYVLKVLARATVRRYKPRIIGITGSVGKTSTRSAIYTVLAKGTDKRVRAAGGNLNNELGLPLAILGDYRTSGGKTFWITVVIRACLRLLFIWSRKNYPDVLILEYGADKPGDIANLTDIAVPDVAVITAVGKIPVHVEYYGSPAEVAKEKATLLGRLGPTGVAVLNIDDPDVFEMREEIRGEVVTFGTDGSADVRIAEQKNISKNHSPYGMSVRLASGGQSVSVTIDGVFGKSQAYAAAAAAAVGLIEGMTLVTIGEALALYKGERGRTRLIKSVKKTFTLDDTYNAAPASATVAVEILRELEAKRKVAVLGDMLELGAYTEEAHAELGGQVGRVADYLVTVGARARFIAEAAKEAGLAAKNIESFDSAEEAARRVQSIIREGDLILVKGSQSMRMEKIVFEIMAEPERAGELLVRQYGKWLK